MGRVTAGLDEHFRTAAASLSPSGVTAGDPRELARLFEAQALSRHLDLEARRLSSAGVGYYTIGSAGHESNAAVAMALRPTDPALLHYRSGGFYCARAAQVPGHDPVRDVLLGLTASRDEPITGGRHKVFGNAALNVIPQTSTIASHLPRAVGLAFALHRAPRIGVATPWPEDAVVVASLGDASINHSTAVGALNAAGHAVHTRLPLPLLVVVEDNGWGISVPSPPGWVETALSSRPGVHLPAGRRLGPAEHPGHRPRGGRPGPRDAEAGDPAPADRTVPGPCGLRRRARLPPRARRDRRPRPRPVAGHRPGPGRRRLVDRGRAGAVRRRALRVRGTADDVQPVEHLASAAEIAHPVDRRTRAGHVTAAEDRKASFSRGLPEESGPLTLAQSVNAALTDVLAACPQAIVLGEDVGTKGGVYGVTLGLQKTFGAARVFDTPLDEQTILGLALGASLAGLLPIAEIQYLAYLHNAEDQLRGEAATLGFFSDGQYANGLVVRIAALASLKGFGGHFHNDNAIGVLRDIPGIVVACPSSAAEAPELLRILAGLAVGEGRVGVLLEPTALYHDKGEAAPYAAPERWRPGHRGRDMGRLHWGGRDVLVVTFGNGVGMSRRAAERAGVAASIFDLRWLAPLPVLHLLAVVAAFPRVLVVDETRRSGGVSEGVVTALVEGGYTGLVERVTAEDSFIPLGPAAAHVVLTEDDVVAALSSLV